MEWTGDAEQHAAASADETIEKEVVLR